MKDGVIRILVGRMAVAGQSGWSASNLSEPASLPCRSSHSDCFRESVNYFPCAMPAELSYVYPFSTGTSACNSPPFLSLQSPTISAIMQSSNSKDNLTSLYYLYSRPVFSSPVRVLSCGRIDKLLKTPTIPVFQHALIYEHPYHSELPQPIGNIATFRSPSPWKTLSPRKSGRSSTCRL